MDHPGLERARTALQKFEKIRNESVGREALADGLAELVEIRTASTDTKLHTVCGNLIETYRTMVEDEVARFLDDEAPCGLDLLLHWYGVMGEFEDLEIQVPESFRAMRSRLNVEVVFKQVEQLSPADRQRLVQLLEKQASDAE